MLFHSLGNAAYGQQSTVPVLGAAGCITMGEDLFSKTTTRLQILTNSRTYYVTWQQSAPIPAGRHSLADGRWRTEKHISQQSNPQTSVCYDREVIRYGQNVLGESRPTVFRRTERKRHLCVHKQLRN
jgi:uncharacterized protein YbdZ (MbtH family)